MIQITGSHFKDETGRTLMLRGVNLGGGSKMPSQPWGAMHLREGFFAHRDVSVVGRPFPLAEADEHLGRLAAWGLTTVLIRSSRLSDAPATQTLLYQLAGAFVLLLPLSLWVLFYINTSTRQSRLLQRKKQK